MNKYLIGLMSVSMLFATACQPQTEAQLSSLSNTSWQLEGIFNANGEVNVEIKQPEKFVLAFGEESSVSSSTDCNGLMGSYEVAEGKITFGPMAQTLMYCEGSQEDVYSSTLSAGGELNATSENLSIKNAETGVTLKFKKHTAEATNNESNSESNTENDDDNESVSISESQLIEGTSWQWAKTAMNDDSEVVPVEPEKFVLTFGEEGRANSTTDCNSAMGNYTLDGTQLSFGPMATTKMFCDGSQEAEYLKGLNEVQSYFIQNDVLHLELKMDSGVMTFNRAEA